MLGRGAAAGFGEAGRGPQVAVPDVPTHAAGELRSQPPGRPAHRRVHQPGHGRLRRVLHEQVYVVVLPVELPQLRTEVTADLPPAKPGCTTELRGVSAVQVIWLVRVMLSL